MTEYGGSSPEQWPEQAGVGFAVSAESIDGWVRVRRDVETGLVSVRLTRGSLRRRTEREVAEQIRSALLAAARAYTQAHHEERRRRYGELPDEILTWGRTQ